MHYIIGSSVLLGLIYFAFGERAARACVQIVLLAGAAGFAYVMYRVVQGTI